MEHPAGATSNKFGGPRSVKDHKILWDSYKFPWKQRLTNWEEKRSLYGFSEPIRANIVTLAKRENLWLNLKRRPLADVRVFGRQGNDHEVRLNIDRAVQHLYPNPWSVNRSIGLASNLGLPARGNSKLFGRGDLAKGHCGLFDGAIPLLFQGFPSQFEGLVIGLGARASSLPRSLGVNDSEEQADKAKEVEGSLPDTELDRVFSGQGAPDLRRSALTACLVAALAALIGGLLGNAAFEAHSRDLNRAEGEDPNKRHKRNDRS